MPPKKTTSKPRKPATGGKRKPAAKKAVSKKGASQKRGGGGGGRRKSTGARAHANQTVDINPNQEAFLANIREVPIVRTAAANANIHFSTHYKWLKEDPTYPERFMLAFEEGTDRVVETAWKLGVEGIVKPVVSGGDIVTMVREYDSKMTAMLAKGWKPKIFGVTEQKVTVSGSVEIQERDRNAAVTAAIMSDPKLLKAARTLTKKVFELTAGDEDVIDAEVMDE